MRLKTENSKKKNCIKQNRPMCPFYVLQKKKEKN